jgi:hypothetical protein
MSSNPDLARLVRSDSIDDTPEELLQKRPTVLLGVTAQAESVLESLNIRSVFDLAASRVFRAAAEIAGVSLPGIDLRRYGRPPADIVDASHRDMSALALGVQRVDVLTDIDETTAEAIATHLGVIRVRDLALWPPYIAARSIVDEAYGMDVEDEDGTPDELVPTAGRFATEVFHYSKIFFDRLEGDGSDRDLIELTRGGDAIDAGALGLDDSGFRIPATGVLARFSQYWIPQSLSLGQLLHSVGLAPGESTKIAVIDWSRQTRGQTDEDIDESERLTGQMQQSRSISEVQQGVAKEVQSGFSFQTASAESYSEGGASGGGLAGFFGGGSGNYGFSENTGSALSVASSAGERSVVADMQQDVQAATRQTATVVRSRRAAIVQETTETEQETLRTRILTNYNHSHALTMHYYEVVQIYRVGIRLDRWQRVLFLPMRTLDFGDPRVLSRWAEVLAAHAPPHYRDKLLELSDTVLVQQLNSVRRRPAPIRYSEDVSITGFAGTSTMSGIHSVELHLRGQASPVVLDFAAGLRQLDEPVTIGQLDRIEVTYGVANTDVIPIVSLAFRVRDPARPGGLRFFDLEAALPPADNRATVARIFRPEPDPTLVGHLERESLRYSQAVWAALSDRDVALLLSRYAFRGQSLAEVVDMQVLTVFGNYLVVRYHADSSRDEAWQAWKEKHLTQQTVEEELIPIPTDGLFAEAILGRSNASEKLDITRFWDWQESPIPMQAPDIAPLQAGMHTVSGAPVPGQLGPATVGFQNPAAFPDPAGLGGLFDLMSSEIFRDMSGLEQTAGTLRESIGTAGDAATEAARLATELEKVKQETLGRIAELAARAGLAAAGGAIGGPAGAAMQTAVGAGGGGGPLSRTGNSRTGALINEGRKIDRSGGAGPNGSSPTGGSAAGGRAAGGAGSGGGGRAGSRPEPVRHSGTSYEVEAFESAVSSPDNGFPFTMEHMSAGGDGAPLPPPVPAEEAQPRATTDERQRAAARQLQMVKHDTHMSPLGERYEWLVYDFAINEATLDGAKSPADAARVLYQRAIDLEQTHGIRVTYHVFGFSDSTGPEDRHTELREQRAQAFFERAIDEMQPLHQYFGQVSAATDGEFVEDNSTEMGRARNRSVLVRETLTLIHEERPPQSPEEIAGFIREAEQTLRTHASQGSGYHEKLAKVLEYYQDASKDMAVFTRAGIDLYIQADRAKSNPRSVPSWEPFELDGREYLRLAFADAQSKEDVIDEVEHLNLLATEGFNYIVSYVTAWASGINPYFGPVHLRDHIGDKQRDTNTLYFVFARYGN